MYVCVRIGVGRDVCEVNFPVLMLTVLQREGNLDLHHLTLAGTVGALLTRCMIGNFFFSCDMNETPKKRRLMPHYLITSLL